MATNVANVARFSTFDTEHSSSTNRKQDATPITGQLKGNMLSLQQDETEGQLAQFR